MGTLRGDKVGSGGSGVLADGDKKPILYSGNTAASTSSATVKKAEGKNTNTTPTTNATIGNSGSYITEEEADAASSSPANDANATREEEEGGGASSFSAAGADGNDDVDDDEGDSLKRKNGVESLVAVDKRAKMKDEEGGDEDAVKKENIGGLNKLADTNSTSTITKLGEENDEDNEGGGDVDAEDEEEEESTETKIAKIKLTKDKSSSSIEVKDPPLGVETEEEDGNSNLRQEASSKSMASSSSSVKTNSTIAKSPSFDNPSCKDDPTSYPYPGGMVSGSNICKEIQERLAKGGEKERTGVMCDDELFVVNITTSVAANTTSAAATSTNAANRTVGASIDAPTPAAAAATVAVAATLEAPVKMSHKDEQDAKFDDDDGRRRRRFLKNTAAVKQPAKEGEKAATSMAEGNNNSTTTMEAILLDGNKAANSTIVSPPTTTKEYTSMAEGNNNNSTTTMEAIPSDGNKIVITVGSRYCPETCNAVPQCERARDYFDTIPKSDSAIAGDDAFAAESSNLDGEDVDTVEEREDKDDDDDDIEEDDTNKAKDESKEVGKVAGGAEDGEETVSDGKIANDPCKADNPTFLYRNKTGHNCDYIAKNSPEICSKLHDGMMVGVVYCPVSCSMVKECEEVQETDNGYVSDGDDVNHVDFDPKTNESVSLSGFNATEVGVEGADDEEGGTSDGPGNVTAIAGLLCEDDTSFLYKNKTGFTCEFIAQHDSEKCFKLIGGKKVGIISCPVSCGMVRECEAMHNVTSEVIVEAGSEEGVDDFGKDMNAVLFGETEVGSASAVGGRSGNATKSFGSSDDVVQLLENESEKTDNGNHTVHSPVDPAIHVFDLIADSNGTSSVSACKDDPSFLYKDNAGYTCQFLGKMYPEKCSKSHNGVTIGVSSCPESCKMVSECLENAAVPANESVASYEADDVTNPSKEKVSVVGDSMKNISMEDMSTDGADEFPSSENDKEKKQNTTVGVGTKSMADEIEKFDAGYSNEGGLNGRTAQPDNDGISESRNDDEALVNNVETKVVDKTVVNDVDDDIVSHGGQKEYQDISHEFVSPVGESGNAEDTNERTYSQTTDAVQADANEMGNNEPFLSNNDQEGAKETNSSINDDGASKYLNIPANGGRDYWNEYESQYDPKTTFDTSFGSLGNESIEDGNISFSHEQEINSVGSVPLPAPRNIDEKQWGEEDDDGLPLGILVVILLALSAFAVYRKSQHRQQRDCSRGGYQRVQVAPDKRDQ